MPVLFILPAMVYLAGVTALIEAATLAMPVDPVQARRRAFKVIQGGKI
ncbi:hypothetical protein [Bradyrhizobium phage BDU-MI-1]|nr:hypothetical protein [Bradyrhizobium phage BDU-MI-1]